MFTILLIKLNTYLIMHIYPPSINAYNSIYYSNTRISKPFHALTFILVTDLYTFLHEINASSFSRHYGDKNNLFFMVQDSSAIYNQTFTQ